MDFPYPCSPKGGQAIEKWDRVTGYILFIIGAVTAWSAVHLSMGKFKHPGPGFLPFGLALALVALSGALIVRQWGKGAGPAPFWPDRTWLRPLLGTVAFGLYAFLLGKLGFVPTTFIFLLLWMGVIERMRWVPILILAVSVTAVLYGIFGYFLEVPLPAGFWE
jgi:putative tricarboxylic transport membrane protein